MERITGPQLTRLLRGWFTPGSGGKSDQLARGIQELVEDQDLLTGSTLPPERELAEALMIGRATVSEAFASLRQEGWIVSVRGSGSRIVRPGPGTRYFADRGTRADDLRLASFSDRPANTLDLSSGAPVGVPFVTDVVAGLTADDISDLVREDGYETLGLTSLRHGIADYYAALGLPVDPDCILVTNGSQQALHLISDALIDPGDSVVLEDPTYRGAISSFRSRGARLLTIPMHTDGPDIDALDRITRTSHPRFIYTLPTGHNPTGAQMSAEKRHAMAEIANERGLIIVEDTSPADLTLSDESFPPLLMAGVASELAIGIGSLSKLFWAGLRVGWIRAPRPIIEHLQRTKRTADLGSSIVSQIVASKLMPRAEEARQLRRGELTNGLRFLEDRLAEHLPEWTWTSPKGGSGLWVRATGVDTEELAAASRERGLSFVAGPAFSPVDGYRDHLRLPFSTDARLDEALATLKETWGTLRAPSVA